MSPASVSSPPPPLPKTDFVSLSFLNTSLMATGILRPPFPFHPVKFLENVWIIQNPLKYLQTQLAGCAPSVFKKIAESYKKLKIFTI